MVALRVFRLAVRGALVALEALPDTARLATLVLRGFDLECDAIFYMPVGRSRADYSNPPGPR
jgi:hypothetical protein